MGDDKKHDVKEDAENIEKEVKKEVLDNSDDENGDADPPTGEGLSEEVFEVEEILSHCYDEGDALYFQVRWRGYGQDDDSWEPAENLGSASNAIKAYWEQEKNAQRRAAKKRGKKRSSSNAKKTDSNTKNQENSKKSEKKDDQECRSKKKKEEPVSEDDDHEMHVSEDDDDEYVSEKKSKKVNKTVTKAALKAYDPPPRTAKKKNSPPPAMSSAKSAAMKHRSSWLFEDEDSDEEDESAKKKKIAAIETPKTKEEKKEASKQVRRHDETVIEVKPPTVIVKALPSPNITNIIIDGVRSFAKNDAHIPSVAEGFEPVKRSEEVAPERSEIQVIPDVIRKRSNYKDARIVRKEDINGSSEIEGILLNRDKSWHAVVKTVNGSPGIIPLEEAHAVLGFKMMQFFLDRVVFK